MKFAIQVNRDGTWHYWRFCRAAKVAEWKDEKRCVAYLNRLQVSNPSRRYRYVGLLTADDLLTRLVSEACK